jgi:hypothetical protein
LEVVAASHAIVGGEPASDNAWLNVGWLESGCTATLVHERVIVFAGHCGVDHERVFFGQAFEVALDFDAGTASLPNPERYESVALTRCELHPEAAIGSGLDVAFCELADAVADRPSVPLVAGCEREHLKLGAPVTMVGFGFDTLEAQGRAGIKRVAQSRVVDVSREVYIGETDAGTCPGDSGGPAFMRVDSEAERPDWRLAAVLSSGSQGRCGVGRYTNVSDVKEWLEAASGHDLTPCFDANDQWKPGPSCVMPPLNLEGEPIDVPDEHTAHCGSPAEPAACSAGDVGARPAAWPNLFSLPLYIFMRLRKRARTC